MNERAGGAGGRPLAGLRVLVTRPAAQAADLASGLEALGAEPVLFPTIELVPAADQAAMQRAVRELADYDWLVFTSVNGVERFCELLPGGELPRGAAPRIACIGPATAEAVRRRGGGVHVLPERYVAESLVEAMIGAGGLAGARVLLPRAAGARAVLPERLAAAGALVDEVHAYRARPARPAAEAVAELRRRLGGGGIDVVTFTASSTVQGFVDVVGRELGGAEVAVIGPITAETARRRGLTVHVEAGEHTIPGLLHALVEHFSPGVSQD